MTSSRQRCVRSRLAETAEERGVEDAISLRALLVKILDEEMHETEVLESEQVLGGYDYDELSESLATSLMGSDIYESSYNVLSLMSCMQYTQTTSSPWSSRSQKGSLSWNLISNGLLVQCLRQRYLRYR